jgi:hypothetical protein
MVYLAKRVVLISEELTCIGLNSSGNADGVMPQDKKSRISDALENIVKESAFLGLRLTEMAAERFLESLHKDNAEEVWDNFNEVRGRFEDEVELIRFIYVSVDKMAFYDQQAAFGNEVAKAFPSIDYDIREAGNCFALGLNTAAVMHSMRVLESGLRALGKVLKVKPSGSGWGRDLNSFQSKWDSILKTKPKQLRWKRAFYPQLFLHFRYFADAWRNRAFHSPAARYGESEAQQVFEHVRDFMQLLATRLSEK